jgi:hypothetical protein
MSLFANLKSNKVSCGFRAKIKEWNLSISSMEVVKGLIVFTPEIDCDQTAMGLPSVTSSVLLIAK